MNGDVLRVQPLGCDDEGNEYWYFYGTRLYKQEPAKDRKIKDWEEEWNTQKNTSLVKRGRGRPKKIKPRRSDGESEESEETINSRSRYMNLGEKSRWSVVCNTLNDWVEFAEKFKDSKSKCERALFRTVTDDFLPVMNEAYQAKEKKLQQKLRELIPKPTFTRMETRHRRTKSTSSLNGSDDGEKESPVSSREQRLEERNRRLNESAGNEPRRRSRSKVSYEEDYSDLDDEPSKRSRNSLSYVENDEDFVKASRKRSRNRLSFIENNDEDLVKATSRRLRNRLSFVENSDEDFVEGAKKSKRRESIEAKANEILKEYVSVVSSSSSNKSQILGVLTQLKLDKNSYPFHYPVDKNEFPDYYNIVTNPMDLARIDRKLRLNIYKTAAEVDDDFKLMIENCELYFGVDSERSEMGRNIWRLFRRLMKELPVPSQGGKSSVSNGTGEKENPNIDKEKTNLNSERSDRAKKKRKLVNSEALDILSKEAELAVERSHSMDEEHFRNFTQNSKKFTQFSDLIVEPIHSHPSDLIQKFMSDSSSHENEDSNTDAFSPTQNKNSDNLASVHQSLPANMEVDDSNLSSEELMGKSDPKSFNILSSDNEDILADNEMYPHSLTNNLPPEKSGDDLNNISASSDSPDNNLASSFVRDSHNLGSSPSSSSFESYHSPNSSNPASSPKDSVNYSSQHVENNSTLYNGYGFVTYSHENGSSTVDASCLGLASANFYKNRQPENGPKTFVAEKVSQATLNYTGDQNCNGFGKFQSRAQVLSRNHSKIRVSSFDDQPIQGQFLQQEISRREPNSTNQYVKHTQAKVAYSYSSNQFIPEQIERNSSKTQFSHSASQQAVQHKMQDSDHLEKQTRWSPPSLSNQKSQDQGNINTQPNGSLVFNASKEVGLEQPRNHQLYSSTDNFTLLQGQRLSEQEASNTDLQNFPSQQEVESHGDYQRSPTNSYPHETERQISGNIQPRSPTFSMQQDIQTHLSVVQEQSKLLSKHPSLFPDQEMQGSEMVKSIYNQASQFSPDNLKEKHSTESQQRHSPNSLNDNQLNQMKLSSNLEGENNRSPSMVSGTSIDNQELNNQKSPKNYSIYWDEKGMEIYPRYSPPQQEMTHHQPAKSQPRYSPNMLEQEINHHQSAENPPRYSPIFSMQEEVNHQHPAKVPPRYSPNLSAQQIDQHQPAKNQPRYSPNLSEQQEMNHQQPAENPPRYSPIRSAQQEGNHQQPAKAPPRYSPNLSAQQMDQHQPAKNQQRYSPDLSEQQEMNHQQPAENPPRYSPILSAQQEINHEQPAKVSPRYSPNPSAQQEMNLQLPVDNQPECPPNVSAEQTIDKSSAKIPFSTSEMIEKPESIGDQSRYSSAFSNQGVFVQESVKTSGQHTYNGFYPSMQNQEPVEAPPFDFENIFSNTFSSVNATSQVNAPPFTVNSSMQIPPQVSMSHFNQGQATRPSFPTMKVRLPPSTGELIVVPGDPSSMTFHLLAKPLSDPSQPIQTSVKIHATNQMRDQDCQNSHDESASFKSKNQAKRDASRAARKQTSPILELQQLASDPISSTSPSSQKNKVCDNVSQPNKSAANPSPPSVSGEFSVIKPNAVLVRPLEQPKNTNSFQQSSFVQQTDGPRTVIFPKGSRMTSVLTNSTNSVPVNVNGLRPIIPNSLPNGTLMQNGNGQYVLVPSKDLLQSNMEQNSKVKNSERPPQFYPSNMIQSFNFQNGQMNPVQMLPQVNFPYVNPYYIVTNPSAFQNVSRYPVMNMQPIPFQNR